MATISPNDYAPAEVVHYTFAGGDFKLGGRTKKYETDDLAIITEAHTHPWLTVEVPVVEPVVGAYVEQISPKDDPMSAMNYTGNDPENARAAERDKVAAVQAEPIAADPEPVPDSKTSEKAKG